MPDFDVIVLGSGAAALTAAVVAHESGARVAVFEKADEVGGTSAWSGGQIWIPNHPRQAEGRSDSREDALTYLTALSHDMIDPAMAETYVDTGPEMVEFLASRTPVDFYAIRDFPDYHSEYPGAKREGGRTLECPPFSFHELGEWADRVTRSPYFPDPNITVGETTLGQPVPRPIDPEIKKARVARDERGMGQALIGRLLRACLDRGIEPETGRRATELVIGDGGVTGVRFEDGTVVRAANVVIATGGFEWDRSLVRAFTRGPMTHPVSVKTNTGDGLKMAMRVGAMLGNMREAWWMPVIEVPTEVNSAGQLLCTYERTMPGSIMVNAKGRRFTNEASNYNAFGAAFHEQDVSAFQYANLPCWLVFNADFYARYRSRAVACATRSRRARHRRNGSRAHRRCARWPIAWASTPTGWRRRSSASTATRARAAIPISIAARRRTICGGAMPRGAAIRARRSARSRADPIMRSR